MSKIRPTPPPGSTISWSTSRSISCNLSGTGSQQPLSKFPCRSGTGRSFASAWRRTMQTPALADSGQTSVQTSIATRETVQTSDSPGGMPLLTHLFLVELL